MNETTGIVIITIVGIITLSAVAITAIKVMLRTANKN